jgi:hypothetical protein
MRLALTVVSPTVRQQADVLLDADPATPVGEVAVELARLLYGGGAEPGGDGYGNVLCFPGPRAGGPRTAGPGGHPHPLAGSAVVGGIAAAPRTSVL